MRNYKWYIAVGLVFVALIVWLNIALYKIREYKANEGKVIRDTTIVVKLDTIRILKPIYIKERLVDTLFVAINDTLRIKDTLYQVVPKTQKYYAKDSLYQAWISGYKPQLDSINVFPKTIYRNITNTVYRKPSKIGFGIIGGYGVSFGDKTQLSPFVGVGVFYKIW